MINYFSAVITALLAVIYAVSRVGFGLPGLNQRTAKLSDVIGPVMTREREAGKTKSPLIDSIITKPLINLIPETSGVHVS